MIVPETCSAITKALKNNVKVSIWLIVNIYCRYSQLRKGLGVGVGSGFVHWTILPCALDVGWIAFATCTTPSIEDHVLISIPILKTSQIFRQHLVSLFL